MRNIFITICLVGLFLIAACQKNLPEKEDNKSVRVYTLRTSETASLKWGSNYVMYCGMNKTTSTYSLGMPWGHGTTNIDYNIGDPVIYFNGFNLEIVEVNVDQIKFRVKPN